MILCTPAGTLSFGDSGAGTGTASVGAHETVTGAETEAFVTGSPAHQSKCMRHTAPIGPLRLAICNPETYQHLGELAPMLENSKKSGSPLFSEAVASAQQQSTSIRCKWDGYSGTYRSTP